MTSVDQLRFEFARVMNNVTWRSWALRLIGLKRGFTPSVRPREEQADG